MFHIFFLISLFTCMIVEIAHKTPIHFIGNLHDKTVVLLEIETLEMDQNGLYKKITEPGLIEISVNIFNAKNHSWEDFPDKSVLVSETKRDNTTNNVFFTAPEVSYYLYEIIPEIQIKSKTKKYALRINEYEGRQKNPTIISQTDNEIKNVANKMEQAIATTTSISEVQKLDAVEDVRYGKLIKRIRNILIIAVLSKIGVFYCIFYLFNRNLHQFYISKKILKK